MEFYFDLQRFGGSPSTEQRLTPSDEALTAMQVLNNYVGRNQYNAGRVEDFWTNMLGAVEPGLIEMASQYPAMRNQAVQQAGYANSWAGDVMPWSADFLQTQADEMNGLIPQYQQIGTNTASNFGRLANDVSGMYRTNVNSLNQNYNRLSGQTASANNELDSYKTSNQNAADTANARQTQIAAKNTSDTAEYNAQINPIISSNTNATNQANNSLTGYIGDNTTNATQTNAHLDAAVAQSTNNAADYNTTLAGLAQQGNAATDAQSNNFNRYINQNNAAYNRATGENYGYMAENRTNAQGYGSQMNAANNQNNAD